MVLAAVALLPADAWSDSFACQGWWDFSCNMQAGWASVLGGILYWMIEGAASALQASLDWTNASDTQLAAIQDLANAFFVQIGVGILILTLILSLSRAGWKMSPAAFGDALKQAVIAILGFRVGLFLFANPEWSVIKLFDQTITNGLMQGMGLGLDGAHNPVKASLGFGDVHSSDDLARVLSDPNIASIFSSAQGTNARTMVVQGLFEIVILSILLLAFVWLATLIFTTVLTFRLLALLTMVAVFPFVMAVYGDTAVGRGALKAWGTTFGALLVSKPLAVVILGVGTTILESSGDYKTFSLNMWAGALIMLILAGFSPLFALKFFQWAGLHASSAQGDPMSDRATAGASNGRGRAAALATRVILKK